MLGVTPEAREDQSAYIANWLKVLKDDRRASFAAAAHTQRAVDYLHGMQKEDPVARRRCLRKIRAWSLQPRTPRTLSCGVGEGPVT